MASGITTSHPSLAATLLKYDANALISGTLFHGKIKPQMRWLVNPNPTLAYHPRPVYPRATQNMFWASANMPIHLQNISATAS